MLSRPLNEAFVIDSLQTLQFLVESRQMTALATASVIIVSGISQRTGACCRKVQVVTAYPFRQAGHGPSQ